MTTQSDEARAREACAHCDQPSITVLDGDALCQRHADEWCRAEGHAAAQADHENPLTWENYRG